MHSITKTILFDIDQALKRFGRYNYFDKSPYEVMDVEACALRLIPESSETVAAILSELSTHSDEAETLAEYLSEELWERCEDRPEWLKEIERGID